MNLHPRFLHVNKLRVVNPQIRQEIFLIKSPYTMKSQILKIDAVFNLCTSALWHGSFCIIIRLLPNTLSLPSKRHEQSPRNFHPRNISLATSDSSVNLLLNTRKLVQFFLKLPNFLLFIKIVPRL